MDYTELREDTKDELTTLRERVRELEASRSLVALDQLVRLAEQNLAHTARIRELEWLLKCEGESAASENEDVQWLEARIRELEQAMRKADGILSWADGNSFWSDIENARKALGKPSDEVKR